jgi:hypothetical protein
VITWRRLQVVALAPAVIVPLAVAGGGDASLYAGAYLGVLAVGLPLGWLVFGRNHPGAWLLGCLLGYGLSATAVGGAVALGQTSSWAAVLVLAGLGGTNALTWHRWRRHSPVVPLPTWRFGTTKALSGVLVLTALIVSVPYARIGEYDAADYRRYRAYFTADFVWHEALTAELARADFPPHNPYAASEPLAYYWSYFIVPATVARITHPSPGAPAPIDTYLKVNGLGTALLFMSAVFLTSWCAVPRATAAGLATGLTLLASSAEGLYAAVREWHLSGTLLPLTGLNVDAVTMWWFNSLTFDGLTRSLWYNPQHSIACAFGLLALTLAMRLRRTAVPAVVGGALGLCLALGLLMSPFPAGTLSLVVAGVLAWQVWVQPHHAIRGLVAGGVAALPIGAALWWCVASGMVAGAGGTLVLAPSRDAFRSPLLVLALAAGPVLLPTIAGLLWATYRRHLPVIVGSLLGVVTALVLYFFVTLEAEPIWIGWRAGQILWVTAPGALALLLVYLGRHRWRALRPAVVGLWLAAGVPTTAIDWYNAQDTSNTGMGPGFQWTIMTSPDEQAAFAWIQAHTPADAIVQMSIAPRGRETWSLVPSFARRRMAAGLPISLLVDKGTRVAADRVDRLFGQVDPEQAWLIARESGIHVLFVGAVEQQAFPRIVSTLQSRPDLFVPVLSNADVHLFAIGCQVRTTCM